MTQTLTATVQDGMLRPDEPLKLPSGTRVELLILVPEAWRPMTDEEWEASERFIEEQPIHSDGKYMTRDQLHERR
jgi:hypothetical protein